MAVRGPSPSAASEGYSLVAVPGLLIGVVSLVERGLYVCGLQWLQHSSSVVVAHGLSCCTPCGIFPDQGSNLCPLHWQVEYYSLYH